MAKHKDGSYWPQRDVRDTTRVDSNSIAFSVSPRFPWSGHVHGDGPSSWSHDDGHHYGGAHRAGAERPCPDPPRACRPAGHGETHDPLTSRFLCPTSHLNTHLPVWVLVPAGA